MLESQATSFRSGGGKATEVHLFRLQDAKRKLEGISQLVTCPTKFPPAFLSQVETLSA